MIQKLKINDFIEIEDRVFQIVLRKQSNGSREWLHPCLIVFRPDEKRITLTDKYREALNEIIENTTITEKDKPIDETQVKQKNIFKGNKMQEHMDDCFDLDNITFPSQVSQDDFVEETENSFICKNCKKEFEK